MQGYPKISMNASYSVQKTGRAGHAAAAGEKKRCASATCVLYLYDSWWGVENCGRPASRMRMSPQGLEHTSDIDVLGVTRVLFDSDPGVVIETDDELDEVR